METCAESGVAATSAALTPSITEKNEKSNIPALDDELTAIHASISDEERDFYLKSYPNFNLVRDKKVHCTVCRVHIGTAPNQLEFMKMHPILRVTHCNKCHDFYNSGEFSKGEDGSELYCRWCGQGGEVFCCAKCPFVFCKSCITKNLPPHIIDDIESNENWECFSCSPMVLWTLRAQHWALMNYIALQKRDIDALYLSQDEYNRRMSRDTSSCCRLAKAKCGNMSDSVESMDSQNSRHSVGQSSKKMKRAPSQPPEAKRQKRSNDEVVCTPDLISMLEPDCQLTVPTKSPTSAPGHSTPKILSIQTNYNPAAAAPTAKNNTPPPLVLRNTGVQIRAAPPQTVIRRTVVGGRAPAPHTPVYHTINGFRIDLNTAARQDTFRLPNGKLIQVKRQGTNNATATASGSVTQRNYTVTKAPANKPATVTPQTQLRNILPRSGITISGNHTVVTTPVPAQTTLGRYHNKTTVVGNTTVTALGPNGISAPVPVRVINQNGATVAAPQPTPAVATTQNISTPTRQVMVHHAFPDNPIGKARSQLQDKVFNAMEIAQHLINKIHTLTHSNAYKNARNLLEVKELYIHLSYLFTYSIGCFKGLQDKCFADMRRFGFEVDANSLQKGQLAAGVDFVRNGLEGDRDHEGELDVDLCGLAEKIHEYRRKIHAEEKLKQQNADDDTVPEPLSPFVPLQYLNEDSADTEQPYPTQEIKEEPPEMLDFPEDDDTEMPEDDEQFRCDDEQMNEPTYDEDADLYGGDAAEDEDELSQSMSSHVPASTEENLNRGEENHAYDRKLTRLMAQYPSIWCTKHYDYGNFEVTRKQWRTICAHFDRTDNVKLRWKNIRKRYVRIEQRIKEGKRFHGYFDKATNFLANRDLPPNEWLPVDCGEDDGDLYERNQLDRIEDELHGPETGAVGRHRAPAKFETAQPIDLLPIDLKIINFVKSNPILWRKSPDIETAKSDEPTRRSLWMHLWKSMPSYKCEEIIDRWQHLYEMYKTFRLKTIKDKTVQSNLELKYAKYLAKLFFLYKINESDLQNEAVVLEDFGLTDDELETQLGSRLRDQPDDKEFLLDLAREVQRYPQLWDKAHIDYYDMVGRDQIWRNIADQLSGYKHKQASDDEDIEIVEPKTDTINLDSDDESPTKQSSPLKHSQLEIVKPKPKVTTITINSAEGTLSKIIRAAKKKSEESAKKKSVEAGKSSSPPVVDFAADALASMLEVKLYEGDDENSRAAQLRSPSGSAHNGDGARPSRKQPTNKPNPTLIEQTESLQIGQLEVLKQNDSKLKMTCAIPLTKVEEEFPYAKELLLKVDQEKSAAKNDVVLDGAVGVRDDVPEKQVAETEIAHKDKPLEVFGTETSQEDGNGSNVVIIDGEEDTNISAKPSGCESKKSENAFKENMELMDVDVGEQPKKLEETEKPKIAINSGSENDTENSMALESPVLVASVENESGKNTKEVHIPVVVSASIGNESEKPDKSLNMQPNEILQVDKKDEEFATPLNAVQLDVTEQSACMDSNVVENYPELTENLIEVVPVLDTVTPQSDADITTIKNTSNSSIIEHDYISTTNTQDETDDAATECPGTTETPKGTQHEITVAQPIPVNDPSDSGKHSIVAANHLDKGSDVVKESSLLGLP